MTSSTPPPPTAQHSNDLEASSFTDDYLQVDTHSFGYDEENSSDEMKNHPEHLESSSSSSDVAFFLQDVDLGEPTSQSGTTHHAICNDHSTTVKRRQRKPQTPKEQFCGCCQDSNSTISMDYDLDDDQVFFDDGGILRYCRILPPRPDEHSVKRRIRFLLWWTMLLDLAVAVVSLLSFGPVVTCCGEPILVMAGMDLDQVIPICLYVYLGVVLLEILPVVREGCIPWNLMNPLLGFALGFVLFLNGAPMVALVTWTIQIVSVALEFVTYRHYSILWKESKQRLEMAERKRGGGHKQERDRRELCRRRRKALFRLRKHMIGVSINVLLVIATLLLIVYLARQEGMCIQNGGTPSLFLVQEEMECQPASKRYETCDLDLGETECYFPFF